jgi:hypothetical protein
VVVESPSHIPLLPLMILVMVVLPPTV